MLNSLNFVWLRSSLGLRLDLSTFIAAGDGNVVIWEIWLEAFDSQHHTLHLCLLLQQDEWQTCEALTSVLPAKPDGPITKAVGAWIERKYSCIVLLCPAEDFSVCFSSPSVSHLRTFDLISAKMREAPHHTRILLKSFGLRKSVIFHQFVLSASNWRRQDVFASESAPLHTLVKPADSTWSLVTGFFTSYLTLLGPSLNASPIVVCGGWFLDKWRKFPCCQWHNKTDVGKFIMVPLRFIFTSRRL